MDGDSACPVVSSAIPQQVENLPPCTNPNFDLGMSEFFMTQVSLANESQVGMKRCATSCEMDDTTNKKRLHSSLIKDRKPTQECFSSVTCEAAKGVVPANTKNTKSSNEWALKKTFVLGLVIAMLACLMRLFQMICLHAKMLMFYASGCAALCKRCARRTERTTHQALCVYY